MNNSDPAGYTEVQHDLLFTDAFGFSIPLDPKLLTAESTTRLATAFRENFSRVRAMAYVPQSIVETATNHLLLLSQAVFDVTGKPVMDDSDLAASRQAVSEAYVARFHSSYFNGKHEMRDAIIYDTLVHNKELNITTGPFRQGFLFDAWLPKL